MTRSVGFDPANRRRAAATPAPAVARIVRALSMTSRRRGIGLLLGIGLGCLAGSSVLADLRYETEITGVDDSALADLLDDVSELKSLQDRTPASEQALRRRADRDLELLSDAARSQGYWDAQFSYRIDTPPEPGEGPAKVIVTAEPGPLYHVAEVNILGPDRQPLVVPRASEEPPLPLRPGEPARTEPVVATETALLADLGHAGHPFAKKIDRRVVIDHQARTMTVTYVLDPGPAMRFGTATVSGLERLDPAYVERRFRWRPGEAYDNREVEETRRTLVDTGLFSSVKIEPVPDPADPDRAAMRVEAVERAHRTIGVGAAYNTSEGIAGRVFWENRNLFGQAEYLNLSAEGGTQKAGVAGTFRRPDLFATDQDLVARAEIARDNPVAYDSRHARLSVGLERRFRPGLTVSGAVSLEKADVEQKANIVPFDASERSQRYSLVGLPLLVKLDRSDDLLNPTRGYRLQGDLVPYQSFAGPNLTFVHERIAGSAYKRLGDSDRYVVAAFAAVSSIQGEALADLPADKRIYAGGGGSVRAYGYQMAGPLDANGNPIGGRSALEVSLEARIKVTKTIGIVPFFDAGSFYTNPVPQLDRGIFYGPGLGFRYYTPFGPLRLDVATPLRRRSADSVVQVYISLGQAF
ncbi:MAG: autotransporter assembly complex family protein [Alphaproteobacteria bacterium]